MKQLSIGLLTGLVILVAGYYLNLKTPDVRYQLSSPIPTDVADPTKVVQQIEITNIGRAVARRVQIKIKKSVGKVTVFKDSQSDNYTVFDSARMTEVIYDSLRPAGRIQIGLSGGPSL